MTRHDPVETVGQVRVFAPTASCRSYRLRWTEPDGTPGDTTGGAHPATAIAKAATLGRRLDRAAGPAVAVSDEQLSKTLREAAKGATVRIDSSHWKSRRATSKPAAKRAATS